jgi:hypothetical protein
MLDDPKALTPKDLKNAPIETIKTELPSLAKALGVSTAELFRALAGGDAPGVGDPATLMRRADCCSSDNW